MAAAIIALFTKKAKTTPRNQPDPTKPPSIRCLLFELPQELVDAIFEEVYAPNPSASSPTSSAEKNPQKILNASSWHHVERRKHAIDSTYTIRPYPGAHVNNFLVSKRFYALAAHAYASQRTWDPVKVDDVKASTTGNRSNIIVNYGGTYRTALWSVHMWHKNLSIYRNHACNIELEVFKWDFGEISSARSDDPMVIEKAIMKSEAYAKIKLLARKLPELKNLHVVPGSLKSRSDEMFMTQMGVLETMVAQLSKLTLDLPVPVRELAEEMQALEDERVARKIAGEEAVLQVGDMGAGYGPDWRWTRAAML